jgi:hypothetical protein
MKGKEELSDKKRVGGAKEQRFDYAIKSEVKLSWRRKRLKEAADRPRVQKA